MPTDRNIAQLDIDDVAYGGRAVGRLDGMAVFVAGALRGERVSVRLGRRHARFREAQLLGVLRASPARTEPVCPLARRPGAGEAAARPWCPGCAYQHADYREELRLKQKQLGDMLRRMAGIAEPPCADAVAAPRPLGYRNKIVLHAGREDRRPALGYKAEDNRTVLDVPDCPLAVPPIGELLAAKRADPLFLDFLPRGSNLTIRHTAADGALCWRGASDRPAAWLTEETAIGRVSVPPACFFQVNPYVSDLLLAAVGDEVAARAPRCVVDLYCGVGMFALAAALRGVPEVSGLDADAAAVEAARANAGRLCGGSIRFAAAPAETETGAALRGVDASGTLVIVDPPRAGLAPEVTAAICAAEPRHLLYVSCAADTLARDLSRFVSAGYLLQSVRLFDMFPRTAAFECLAALTRG